VTPAEIRRRLLRWFDAAKRDLPWRFPPGQVDPYRVWISEAMLQQTQVATVIPYYRRFLDRFPTIEALARADEDELLALWSGLGYYARARALHRAAGEALARHGGLPRTLPELRALPGFGPYTAGAVASIAFGLGAAAVDGNVGRVLARFHAVRAARGSRPFRERIHALAAAIVEDPSVRRPGDLNQALIELGALLCRPRRPACRRCPLASGCSALRMGEVERFPKVARRSSARLLRLAVGLLWRDGKLLLVKRPAPGLFAGMWGPPAVELRDREAAGPALSAAIEREPSAKTGGIRHAGSVERRLTHRLLHMEVEVGTLRGEPKRAGGWRLAEPEQLADIAIPTALRAAIAAGRDALPSAGHGVRHAGAAPPTPGRGGRREGPGEGGVRNRAKKRRRGLTRRRPSV
jgi:A/G-specific adenine glycosylase